MSRANFLNTGGLDYETKKKIVLQSEPLTKKVSLSEIDVDRHGSLFVNGTRLATDPDIHRQFLDILNLNPAFLKRFEDLAGEKSQEALISMIKTGLTLKDVKNQEITLLANPNTKMVSHMLPGHRDFISNRMAIELFERIANKYDTILTPTSFDIKSTGGFDMSFTSKVTINPLSKTGVQLPDERYNPGLNLSSDPLNGLAAGVFAFRQVCSNGMVMWDRINELFMHTLNEEAVEKFLGGVSKLESNNFASIHFDDRLNRAMNTPASFDELLTAKELILGSSVIRDVDEPEFQRFLPEFSHEVHRLASKGIDYAACTDRQLKILPTESTVWDVVNRLTYFGSHDHNLGTNFARLQHAAGKMFTRKRYDQQDLEPLMKFFEKN